MMIIDRGGWRFFVSNAGNLDANKCGKWLYFFKGTNGKQFAEEMCKKCLDEGMVVEAKRSDSEVEGVACFYLNCDDLSTHRRIIDFFLENNMIRRTKEGKLYNISFKLDRQTQDREYGKSYYSDIKLSHFIDLNTGKWLLGDTNG